MARRFILAAALCATPAAAYVTGPATGRAAAELQQPWAATAESFELREPAIEAPEETSSGALNAVLASFGIGAALGWLKSRGQQVASAAGAAAIALAPAAAPAIVDYGGVLIPEDA